MSLTLTCILPSGTNHAGLTKVLPIHPCVSQVFCLFPYTATELPGPPTRADRTPRDVQLLKCTDVHIAWASVSIIEPLGINEGGTEVGIVLGPPPWQYHSSEYHFMRMPVSRYSLIMYILLFVHFSLSTQH